MKYIDNLIGWGDQLFRQDTMETINLATQLYVLAADLLGPKPEIVPPLVDPVGAELRQLLAAESRCVLERDRGCRERDTRRSRSTSRRRPALRRCPAVDAVLPHPAEHTAARVLGHGRGPAYKIRHCMNIQGVVQQLPLFAPPINPGLLVAAAAAGLDLSSVLSDTAAAVPPYRFRTMIRHALELCDQVREPRRRAARGAREAAMPSTSRAIRSSGEIKLQTAIDDVRTRQIDAANQELDVLAKSQAVVPGPARTSMSAGP